MTQRLTRQQIKDIAIISGGPVLSPTASTDRGFGLPTALYVATVTLYLAFIAVMAGTFLNPELAIPMVIFAGFILLAFGLAGIWTTMKPDNAVVPPSWREFTASGIDTLSGRLTASEAAIQVLLLPVLILGWGLAIAVIVALT